MPTWSKDGRWVYFSSNRSGERQIWKQPLEGGDAVQVTINGGFEACESADGRFLYYTKEREVPGVWRVPIEGGVETYLPELAGVRYYRYWAVTGLGIYFVPEIDAVTTNSPRVINLFNFSSGKVTAVASIAKPPVYGPSGLAVSPDGRWILLTQVDQTSSDIMVVKNFR